MHPTLGVAVRWILCGLIGKNGKRYETVDSNLLAELRKSKQWKLTREPITIVDVLRHSTGSMKAVFIKVLRSYSVRSLHV